MSGLSLDSILETLNQLEWSWISVLDIALVTAVIFSVFLLLRGTRGVQVLRGLVVILLAVVILASIPGLIAFRSLINSILPVLLLSFPIIFQPELRRALEQVGRAGQRFRFFRRHEISPVVTAVKEACSRLSQRRHGALITFERDTGLQEYIDTGILLNAAVSPELLLTIFNKHTELHDGAVIIRAERLAAAACVMPLSTSSLSDRQMGLRHRAALGISEVSDAVTVVVSEETGQISITQNGRFVVRRLEVARLDEILHTLLSESAAFKGGQN
jgi:diadenylate cyclase